MKRLVKILGNIVVWATVVLFTTSLVMFIFVELPQEQNNDLGKFYIAWLVIAVLAVIYTVWRILKFSIYQLFFEATKAICEAKKHKNKE